jgi:hypothetical protein
MALFVYRDCGEKGEKVRTNFPFRVTRIFRAKLA